MRFGIDIGSTAVKAVLLGSDREIIKSEIVPSGAEPEKTACEVYDSIGGGAPAAATGYGRKLAGFAFKKITEITCHAKGVFAMHPDVRTIIDIGGQDSKSMLLAGDGKVAEFAMNDKCAAGTGSFLETIARRFNMSVEDFSSLASKSTNPVKINSTCVVFAESEVVGLLAKGVKAADIVAGIHAAAASRVGRLFRQVEGKGPVYFSGGVAYNDLMRECLSAEIGVPVIRADNAQLAGAYGAALLA